MGDNIFSDDINVVKKDNYCIGNLSNIENGRSYFSDVLKILYEKGLIDCPTEYPYNIGENGFYSFIVKFKNKDRKTMVTIRTISDKRRIQVNHRMIEHNRDLAEEMELNDCLICCFKKSNKMYIINNTKSLKRFVLNETNNIYLSEKRIKML